MMRKPQCRRDTAVASGRKQRCIGASACAGQPRCLRRQHHGFEKPTLRCRDQSSSQLAWPSPPNHVAPRRPSHLGAGGAAVHSIISGHWLLTRGARLGDAKGGIVNRRTSPAGGRKGTLFATRTMYCTRTGENQPGSITVLITWMTPLDCITLLMVISAVSPLASMTQKLPFFSWIVSVPPCTVFSSALPPPATMRSRKSLVVRRPGTT